MKLTFKSKPKPKAALKKPATYPSWIFDGSPIADPFGYGERAVKFLRALSHPKNPLPGHPFQLDLWQERIVRAIYGPRHADGTRIVKTVVMLLPRGNRKTSLAAALALLHTFGPERTPGGEVLSAASDRSQAKIAFQEAVGIIRNVPQIAGISRIADHKHKITNGRHASFYACVSNDAASAHGHTPVFALIDEIHAWKKRDLWDAIKSGMSKTSGSLMIIATTAGRGQENLAHEQIAYARKVAKGEIIDPATLPVLFETPSDADWEDEAVWHLANPGLAHGYPDIGGLRQMAKEARDRPGDRLAFQQFHLNLWQDSSESPFVDMSIYDAGAAPIDLEDLRGEPCWLGVDLSSNRDLTAVVAAWRDPDIEDGYIVHPWFFCPRDNLQGRADRDGVPYPTWAEDGHIIPTPGNVVDFRTVENHIRDLCDEFDVREIAFDPHLARVMMSNLAEDGFPAVEMRQGWVTMAPAIKELERAIVAKRFRHGGQPVLRWNFDNIVATQDSAGNTSFHKGKAKDRIDGAVAAAMAVGRASAGEDTRSIYDTDERPDGLMVW
jgi:phage terminase large subunit-like protein